MCVEVLYIKLENFFGTKPLIKNIANTYTTNIGAKAAALAEIRPRRPVRVIADNTQIRRGTYFSIV